MNYKSFMKSRQNSRRYSDDHVYFQRDRKERKFYTDDFLRMLTMKSKGLTALTWKKSWKRYDLI